MGIACALSAPAAPAKRHHRRPSVAAKRGFPSSKIALVAKKRAIDARIPRVRQRLAVTKKKQFIAGRAYAQSRTRLKSARQELKVANTRLRQAKAALQQATSELHAAQDRLARHVAALSERLRILYARSHSQPFGLAQGASGFSDFAHNMYLMQRIARQDLDLLDQIKDETERIARYRTTVQRQKEQVSVLQAQAAEKHEAVARETAACARWVSQLAQERAAYERALAELERNSREIEAMIQRLQRSPAGRTRFMRPWRGSFMRPVAGPIVSGFGYRIHPIYKVRAFHNGLDIAAPTGTPILAAGAGYVIHSGWWGGYGNCVIIDHGGGVSTVYGHCSSLVARAGQKVRRGQVIAAVGSTGLSTGPHLHFEVRHSGKPVPPQ